MKIKRILFPTDFSKHSLAALEYARSFSEKFQAQLHVLHVVHNSSYMVTTEGAELPRWSDEELVGVARESMDKLLGSELAGSGEVIDVIEIGNPLVQIVRYARNEKVDLIVMATHGRSGLAHIMMGSVAEKVVRKASCPVLTVRHPEHKFEMP